MLTEAYKLTQYQVAGHGPRNLGVLKEALSEYSAESAADIYGTGPIISSFEEKIAAYLGKEAAVFFPSGTMAQQIALRIWCDQAQVKKVAYHPLCHLEIHEQHGLKELHGIEGVLLGEADRLFTIEDIKATIREQEIGAVLFELPQREIGGQLPSYENLLEMVTYVKAANIPCHLDGARLFECLPYYEKEAHEISSLFDSVYLSFYKGIGGITGAILAGTKGFVAEAKIWKRRHGGDLISLYPYIISADYYFEQRMNKMGQYAASAKELAALFAAVPGVQVIPEIPVTNMFHIHWMAAKEKLETLLETICTQYGVGLSGYVREIIDVQQTEKNQETGKHCYFEVSLGDSYEKIPKELLKQVFEELHQR